MDKRKSVPLNCNIYSIWEDMLNFSRTPSQMFCISENIKRSMYTKTLCEARLKMLRHLYISTEIKRLRNVYGPVITNEMIDDEVAESLAGLIMDGEYNGLITHLYKTVL